MLLPNPRATRAPYPDALRAIMNVELARSSRRMLAGWELLSSPSPLRSLPNVARRLGLGALHVKDESARSPLASFKVLGAPVALLRLLQARLPGAEAADLLAGRHADRLRGFVVASATDGNHGRALAAAARSVGCGCAIVLHAHVSPEREAGIAALGAKIERIAGNYDDSVREAGRMAQANGWQVVSDTSYEGYEAIPRDVMQGYAILADEVLERHAADAACPYTHVLLQGGVGGLAAGVASFFWEQYGARRPAFVVVEPQQADCLLQSAVAGRPARASGSVDSVMAGLACGEASPLAWRFLEGSIDFFQTVTDQEAVSAMRSLASAEAGDVPIVAGESGAAGFAGLQALCATPALAGQVGLDAAARVLLVNTEGATAPRLYEQLTGLAPARVLDAQRAWHHRSRGAAA